MNLNNGNEIKFPDTVLLVSKTDKNGIITYANDDFVNISGFTRDELLGKPHNIVRHRDMPKKAFQIIWKEHLLKGKEWSGVVKNSCKNKVDFYLVYAHITPIFKDKQIVGFTSVRRSPTSVEKKNYLDFYKKLR